MNDLISRQQAIEAFYQYPNVNWTTLDVMDKINGLPSAQPERKPGRWIYRKELSRYGDIWSCSECNEKTTDSIMGKPRPNFCPLCGADMRGEQ